MLTDFQSAYQFVYAFQGIQSAREYYYDIIILEP